MGTYGNCSNTCSGSGTSHVGGTVNVSGAKINRVRVNGYNEKGGVGGTNLPPIPENGSGIHVNESNYQPRETDVIIGSVTPHLVESRFCSDVMESVKISSFQVIRHSSPTQTVSRLWNVGLETAQRTLRATTQQGIRSAVHPIFRQYRVDHLHFHRKRLHVTFHTDTLFSKIISLRGNKCSQVFTNGAFTTAVTCGRLPNSRPVTRGPFSGTYGNEHRVPTTGTQVPYPNALRRKGEKEPEPPC